MVTLSDAQQAASAASPEELSVGEAHVADLELARRAAWGGTRAQRAIAERVVSRVRRAANALMGSSSDIDDAVQHALVEVLRSVHTYRAKRSLVAWADRVAAQSIVRFARAFHDRADHPTTVVRQGGQSLARGKRSARGLEDQLSRLSAPLREVLLLHYTFGFKLARIARLTQRPLPAVREQLLTAQRRLLELALGADSGLWISQGLGRWLELRDREMRGEALSPAEVQECERLRAEEESVRVFASQLDELACFQSQGATRSLGSQDRAVVRNALSVVALSSAAASARRLDQDQEARRPTVEPEGARRVRIVSMALCGLMVLLAGLGLFLSPSSLERVGGGVRSVHRLLPAGRSTSGGNPKGSLSPSMEAACAGLAAVEVTRRGASSVGSASKLFSQARELSAQGRFGQAVALFSQLSREHPEAREGREALVASGQLRLEQLGQPEQALADFERYLAGPAGPKTASAMLGRIRALRALGREEARLAALREYLRLRTRDGESPDRP